MNKRSVRRVQRVEGYVARMEEGSDVQTWGVVRVHGVEGNKKINSQ